MFVHRSFSRFRLIVGNSISEEVSKYLRIAVQVYLSLSSIVDNEEIPRKWLEKLDDLHLEEQMDLAIKMAKKEVEMESQ